jgi:ssDNA-binding Zn-finger/Zn-ribbon topoisomerase 1
MEHYYNKLLDLRNKKQITKDKHIKNINEIQFKISNNICPRCGGKLIVRNGRNGNFYGCSNYPKCKFTKNIKD